MKASIRVMSRDEPGILAKIGRFPQFLHMGKRLVIDAAPEYDGQLHIGRQVGGVNFDTAPGKRLSLLQLTLESQQARHAVDGFR